MDKVFYQMVVTTDGELAKPPISREMMTQAIRCEVHRKVLLRAAELVAMGWTRRVGARNELGQKVVATDPQAVSWCLNGPSTARCWTYSGWTGTRVAWIWASG